ncbi:MAG: cytochrome c3 family protein [Desulfobacteraceae bacterium]
MMTAKTIFLSLMATALVCFSFSDGFSQDTDNSGEKDRISYTKQLTLSVPEGKEARKADVEFPHQDHIMQFGCGQCHHEWDHTELESPETCVACHDDFEDRQATESYYNAFHNRDSSHSCTGCHNEMADEESGVEPPRRCSECHPRPERD